ncbi:DprA-like DNA processing chain A [Mycobacterium phage Anthony]|uniref:DprA-like DNA processing chain A n=1 Tax=Mycobacterium phage Anthony TaxID=2599857 RepID=A0A5J6TKB7_9CAUD|nr:DprA-like DNA processing chain A [Mycobacterium phage Anthony]QFG10437.1 DprA-like DNA processing chain A [Mycobacterium phage Anthony]
MTLYRRILITGSREWEGRTTVWSALNQELIEFGRLTIVHGAARGADDIADRWAWGARQDGYQVEIERYPADWNTLGKRAGTIRNQEMVDLGADVCHAFPLRSSVGTWHCMRAATRAGIQVVNHGWKQFTN